MNEALLHKGYVNQGVQFVGLALPLLLVVLEVPLVDLLVLLALLVVPFVVLVVSRWGYRSV